MPLIGNLSLQKFHGFQEDCFQFHDLIYDHLEASYLGIPFTNKKLWVFLILANKDNTNEDTSTRRFQGLFD